jgi:hypothetical protein
LERGRPRQLKMDSRFRGSDKKGVSALKMDSRFRGSDKKGVSALKMDSRFHGNDNPSFRYEKHKSSVDEKKPRINANKRE